MRRALWTGVTVLLGIAFVAATGMLASQGTPASARTVVAATLDGTMQTPQGEMQHATLQLSSWPDSLAPASMGGCHGEDGGEHPDWVTFCPGTNFELPANSAVTIRVLQHDGGEVLNNPYFAQVIGTIDGTATLNGETFTSIPPNKVGHTFTMHSIPGEGQPDIFVSVPLQAANEENLKDGYPVPNVVEFTFYTGSPGKYYWNCEFPCGDGTYANFGGPMSTQGYMAGEITVK